MKRLIAVILCLLLVCSMCACGGKEEDSSKEVETTPMESSINNEEGSDVSESSSGDSDDKESEEADMPTLEDAGYESEEAPKIEPESVSKASLTWRGLKGSKKFVVEVNAVSGTIRVLKKGQKSKIISKCHIPEGMIMDVDHVMETLKFEDFNGDGYDDLYVEDLQDDNPMHHVFFWNADAKKFEIEAGA